MSPLLFAFAVLIVAVGFLSLIGIALGVAAKRGDDAMERLIAAKRRSDDLIREALAYEDCHRQGRTHRVYVDGVEMPVRRGGGR